MLPSFIKIEKTSTNSDSEIENIDYCDEEIRYETKTFSNNCSTKRVQSNNQRRILEENDDNHSIPDRVTHMHQQRYFSAGERRLLLIEKLKNIGPIYAGLNYIIEFQQITNYEGKVMYYCHLCRQGEDENSIVKHCTRYLHLFRYWKTFAPIEYKRHEKRSANERLKVLKNLLSLLHKRLFKNEKPELYYVRDMEQDYYDKLYSLNSINKEIYVIDSDAILALEQNDSQNIIIPSETILENIKRSDSPVSNDLDQNNDVQNVVIKSEPMDYEPIIIDQPKFDDEIKKIVCCIDTNDRSLNFNINKINKLIEFIENNVKTLNISTFNKITNVLDKLIPSNNKR